MEVVVDGNLVSAADGQGFRAFVMGTKGIQEQARLLDISKLQSAINAAAVWQVASVVVAQKHLADISRKLDDIKKGVEYISRFLDNQRRARVSAIFEYLRQLRLALTRGEVSDATRHELEACERDLIEIQEHLMMEYRQKVDAKVEGENFGTATLCERIEEKVSDLDQLAQDLATCLKVRITAWHILSMWPGASQLRTARRTSIEESIAAVSDLGRYGQEQVQAEIDDVRSFWNREETLAARRAALTDASGAAFQRLSDHCHHGTSHLQSSERILLEDKEPVRMILHLEDGVIVEAKQLA